MADDLLVPDVLPRPDQLDSVDRALVNRCADGDLSALETLYARHGAAVWGCAEVAARRPSAPPAEDIAAGAFLAIWAEARHVLESPRTVEALLVLAVSRLGFGRTALT